MRLAIKNLVEVPDLIAAVGAASAGNELTITSSRDGKRQDVKVTPERRRDINFYMPTPGGLCAGRRADHSTGPHGAAAHGLDDAPS